MYIEWVGKNCFCNIFPASIMMPPNGTHPMLPPPKIDSPSYYQYSPHPQDPSQHMVAMAAHHSLPNGQSQLSPSGNPHKRLKRSTMSSISSTEDDQESIGDDAEQMTTYYKSPGGMAGQPSSWQDPNMDPGESTSLACSCCLPSCYTKFIKCLDMVLNMPTLKFFTAFFPP